MFSRHHVGSITTLRAVAMFLSILLRPFDSLIRYQQLTWYMIATAVNESRDKGGHTVSC